MQYLGINYEMKHAPKLDPTFIPFGVWRNAYLAGAKKPIAIAVERDKGGGVIVALYSVEEFYKFIRKRGGRRKFNNRIRKILI